MQPPEFKKQNLADAESEPVIVDPLSQGDEFEKTVILTGGIDVDKTYEMDREFDRLSKNASGMIGQTLNDQFEVLSLIGEGGMSFVYKAKHTALKKIVAIKMLRPHLLQHPSSLRRLQQEALAVSHLEHPNTVAIRHFAVTGNGEPYLVMDYLEGQSLADCLQKSGHLPVERALPMFCQIAAALAHAHDKGIVHRDLKASNVLLVEFDGKPDFVKIVDFGIAKISAPDEGDTSTTNVTMTGEIFGSPMAMSPEQCRGEKLDLRSDIYSFGSLMYEMLTGRTVFVAKNTLEILFKQVHETPDSFKVANPQAKIPPKLEAIVMKALEKNPDQRYQSMRDLLKDLEGLGQTGTFDGLFASVGLASRNKRRMRNFAIFGCLLVGVIVSCAVALVNDLHSQALIENSVLAWQIPPADHRPTDDKVLSRAKLIQEKAAAYYDKVLADQVVANVQTARPIVDEIMAAGSALYKHGMYRDSVETYAWALRIAEHISGVDSADANYFRKVIGDSYNKNHEYNNAFKEYEKVTSQINDRSRVALVPEDQFSFANDKGPLPSRKDLSSSPLVWDAHRKKGDCAELKPDKDLAGANYDYTWVAVHGMPKEDLLSFNELGLMNARAADSGRISGREKLNKVQQDYLAARDAWETALKDPELNDQEKRRVHQNLALCDAYLAALGRIYPIASNSHKLPDAIQQMRTYWGTQHPYTQLTEQAYVRELWDQHNYVDALMLKLKSSLN